MAEQVLATLGEEDREILRLRYIADLSVKDIASVMQLNFVTVRVRIHRALARARVALNV
jgi:RNA polymerase sigma factor (sigma-70 family)